MLISYELNIYSGFRFYSFKWCTFQLVWWCIFQLVYTGGRRRGFRYLFHLRGRGDGLRHRLFGTKTEDRLWLGFRHLFVDKSRYRAYRGALLQEKRRGIYRCR